MAPDERGNWCSRIISSQLSVLLLLMKVVIASSELAESQNWSLNYLQRELEFSTVCSKKPSLASKFPWLGPLCIAVRAEWRTSCGRQTGLPRHFSSFAKIFTKSFSHHHLTTHWSDCRSAGLRKKQIAPVPQNGVTGAGNADHRDNITDWGRRWFLSDSSHPIFHFGFGLQNLEPDTSIFLALITMWLQWHLNSLYTQIQCSIRFDHSMAAITVIITSSGVALQFKAFGGGIMRRRASFNETRLLNRCRLPAYYAWHTLCCDWCTVSSCPLEYMLLLSSIHFRDARPMENRHKFDKTSVGQSCLYILLIVPTNFVLEPLS